jgi:lysophospholipase L1-like esterase
VTGKDPLQRDGFHLSRLGHDLIGEAIGRAILADVKQKSRLMAAPLAANAQE